MDEGELLRYENSPIRVGEYYYCSFYNQEWHLCDDDTGSTGYSFLPYGKVFPVRTASDANTKIGGEKAQGEGDLVCEKIVGSDGKVGSSGSSLNVFKKGDEVFVKIGSSLPKRCYLRNEAHSFEPCHWFIEVEMLYGYFNMEGKKEFYGTLEGLLDEHKVVLKKVEWHKLSRELKRNP